MPLNVAANVVGKKSICWDCGEEFVLDEINMQDDKPTCMACGSKETNSLIEYMREKGL